MERKELSIHATTQMGLQSILSENNPQVDTPDDSNYSASSKGQSYRERYQVRGPRGGGGGGRAGWLSKVTGGSLLVVKCSAPKLHHRGAPDNDACVRCYR